MSHPLRQPGALAGKMQIADDFDAPMPEDILKRFASFDPHFMADGRGDQEQAERKPLDAVKEENKGRAQ